eukprot:31315-Pelagococcus_subviridis.AAC.14
MLMTAVIGAVVDTHRSLPVVRSLASRSNPTRAGPARYARVRGHVEDAPPRDAGHDARRRRGGVTEAQDPPRGRAEHRREIRRGVQLVGHRARVRARREGATAVPSRPARPARASVSRVPFYSALCSVTYAAVSGVPV